MSCPNCGHTMAALERTTTETTWLCDRCGTVKRVHRLTAHEDVYTPKLVERCRKFERRFDYPICSPAQDKADWHLFGIREAINLPENRGPL